MCKHENHMLIGKADGIHCRGCGAVFNSFKELSEAPERGQEKPKKKKGGKTKDD